LIKSEEIHTILGLWGRSITSHPTGGQMRLMFCLQRIETEAVARALLRRRNPRNARESLSVGNPPRSPCARMGASRPAPERVRMRLPFARRGASQWEEHPRVDDQRGIFYNWYSRRGLTQ